jgi:maltooligosyltrehalose trehalohydrolase
MTDHNHPRRMPIGAECIGDGGVDFRIWAPRRKRVDIVLEGGAGEGTTHPCTAQDRGYFAARVRSARTGTLYRIRLDGGSELYPDPASRAQPSGPHGPSQVVDPTTFVWSDSAWKGVERARQVIYEMHVGTFTGPGTWAAAMEQLPELAALGISVVEMMPIGGFPGRFGWGYDGVNLFAPTHLYGEPDDLRRFVDRAHAAGMGVILDVVYNHFGPDGNYLPQFSDTYFDAQRKTDWGSTINYDGKGSGPVREYVLANAHYWVDEFHFDGLRLDATQDIHDSSPDHVIAALARSARAAAPSRRTLLVAENEPQSARLARPAERGGDGLDALWNDDFHHTALVALTGHGEAYYTDYGGTPQEFVSSLKRGFLYQGQYYGWQKKARGSAALDLSPQQFVSYLENHDQVANTAFGERLHLKANRSRHRALVTLVLLGPSTPLLFQGEEFASSSPFLYFADHQPELAASVRQGRHEFLAQFPSMAAPEVVALLAAPEELATFQRCKLDFAERKTHATTYAFYRDALALRHRDSVFTQPAAVDGAVLGATAFVIRLFGAQGDDRLILVNLGPDAHLARAPEPLLAPPEERRWELLFSSEDPRYGGAGTPPLEREGKRHLFGEAAVVLRAVPVEKR